MMLCIYYKDHKFIQRPSNLGSYQGSNDPEDDDDEDDKMEMGNINETRSLMRNDHETQHNKLTTTKMDAGDSTAAHTSGEIPKVEIAT